MSVADLEGDQAGSAPLSPLGDRRHRQLTYKQVTTTHLSLALSLFKHVFQ